MYGPPISGFSLHGAHQAHLHDYLLELLLHEDNMHVLCKLTCWGMRAVVHGL
jgi:hypothetical protein